MKLGIIGQKGSGKNTVFNALTHSDPQGSIHNQEDRLGTIRVPDKRVDKLSLMYNLKKTTYAQVEYFLPAKRVSEKGKDGDQQLWNKIRESDALIHVIRNFRSYGLDDPSPYRDFKSLEQELILSDLVAVEKRIERVELDKKRGKKINTEEYSLLLKCKTHLEDEIPLRKFPEIAFANVLRGFAFLSAKPMLVLFNNEDEDDSLPDFKDLLENENCSIIRGKLEEELCRMSKEEAMEFLKEFNIKDSAMDRVIERSYFLMGLISFFTVGDDEVKAWTIKKSTSAVEAAGAIHSDIQKGFIRAEVLHYDDLMASGSYAESRKRGTVRLEGKTYLMCDGDIVHFRFNV